MLFSAKNRVGAALALWVALAGAALGARAALGLTWRLHLSPAVVRAAVLGFGAILACDGLVHGALLLLFGERYRTRYRALADYFRPQGPLEIGAGGLLAGGGEEPFFRGVLLQGLMSCAGLGPAAAIGLSALIFGALHTARDPRVAPFALWAGLQGILLGSLYVATGSLLATMLVHAAHDVTGFCLFAWQRGKERSGPA
jgi:membrane protease YdiL (CAAX protease family)